MPQLGWGLEGAMFQWWLTIPESVGLKGSAVPNHTPHKTTIIFKRLYRGFLTLELGSDLHMAM